MTAPALTTVHAEPGLARPRRPGVGRARLGPTGIAVSAALFALALAIRIYRLGEWSFWLDEVYTVIDAYHLRERLGGYPLFYTVERAVFELFGVSEFTSRIVPAVVGAVSVPLLVPWFHRFARRPGMWGSLLLLALSPWHLYWSQVARYYTLLMLLETGALYAFYVGVVEGRRRLLAISFLLALLTFLTHFTGGIFVAIAAGFILLRAILLRSAPSGAASGRVLALVLALLILSAGYVVFAILPDLGTGSSSWGDSPGDLFEKLAYYLTPSVLALAALGLVLAWRNSRDEALFLGLAAGLPTLFLLLVHSVQDVNTRYLFSTMPAYLALAGISLTRLWRVLGDRRRALWAGAVLLLILPSLQEDVLYFVEGHGNREPWKDAVAFARREGAPGARILGYNDRLPAFYAGLPRIPSDKIAFRDRPEVDFGRLEREGREAWILVRRRLITSALEGRSGTEAQRSGEWLIGRAELEREFGARLGRKDRTVQVYRYVPRVALPGRLSPAPGTGPRS
ncbi:MAG: glycosyltransferase family 39 protein [Gemmatimonadetes bacterium]|nr:glycosyltransferase family 39 protein [Gemmatimonadota bacterium]